MHAISSYRGNRPTNTHKQTNPPTGPITIPTLRSSYLARSVKIRLAEWSTVMILIYMYHIVMCVCVYMCA